MKRTLLERLDGAGSIGCDLSPGDPLCAEAAERIKALEKEIAALIRARDLSARASATLSEESVAKNETIRKLRKTLETSSIWLRSALDQKNWHWDSDQRAAAEDTYQESMRLIQELP